MTLEILKFLNNIRDDYENIRKLLTVYALFWYEYLTFRGVTSQKKH